ncbi:cell wall hydrolase [Defluviicoccus vanus]|uniref:cell wall hydrolase n=1 Tax=Defluviicoccus vanus TaxID=111831 RepID=UPI001CBA651E|nr:cell wall hydrolase [Defluviicoccus vanus]
MGGPDPTLLEGEETGAPITPLTEIPRAMRERLANASPDLLREFKCLALNVYWEAKGEPLVGQMAVAAVTLNRLGNPRFPKSVCEVVWQGVESGRANCQFSWACDQRGDRPLEDIPWQRAQQVAYRAMFLDPFDPTNGALYFHAIYVRPQWADEKARIMRIGRHIFYGENPTLPSLINVANRS